MPISLRGHTLRRILFALIFAGAFSLANATPGPDTCSGAIYGMVKFGKLAEVHYQSFLEGYVRGYFFASSELGHPIPEKARDVAPEALLAALKKKCSAYPEMRVTVAAAVIFDELLQEHGQRKNSPSAKWRSASKWFQDLGSEGWLPILLGVLLAIPIQALVAWCGARLLAGSWLSYARSLFATASAQFVALPVGALLDNLFVSIILAPFVFAATYGLILKNRDGTDFGIRNGFMLGLFILAVALTPPLIVSFM